LLQGFDVEDLSSKGAAGICDKSDDSVAVDKTLLEVGATPEEERKKLEYLEGVTDHEKVHRDEQAATFTADEIVTRDGTVITIKDAFEGHAIDEAGQNIEDLTPEYRVHHDQYLKLASIVTKEKIKKALKSGDMIGVQIAALAA
jgi:MoaA/NifB/PqqE/SkfB family radical SAM enzyme